ncbi:hypothetical protein HOG21_02835 [bacterium]|nr:hypothetical protein [bacterium]
MDEVKEYALLYIKENMKTPEGEKMEHLNNRLKMIMQSFSKILDDENLALANDRKATEKELKIIEDRKNKWFNEENKLF